VSTVPSVSVRRAVVLAALTVVTGGAGPAAAVAPQPVATVSSAPRPGPSTTPSAPSSATSSPSGTSSPGATASPTPTPTSGPAAAPPDTSVLQPPAVDDDVCRAASRESPVVVDVTRLAPRAPTRPDEPFEVAGRLVNCGQEDLDLVQVRLSVGGRISSRSELRLADAEPTVGFRRLPSQDADRDVLAPGATATFAVRVLVEELRLGRRNGVYPLSVQARARGEGDRLRGPVGLASTFVPWFPEGPVAPTRLAWVLPLVDEPDRTPAGVQLDAGLEARLRGDRQERGRLARALVAGRAGAAGACGVSARPPAGATPPAVAGGCRGEPVPLTYAVDPDLLDAVEAMTRSHRVLVDGDQVERPASADAQQWLADVRAAAQEGDVLALPYGDPDVVALSRTDSPVRDDVELLDRLGRSEARRVLGEPPLSSVAFPPPGPVTEVVDPLAAGQGVALLLEESVLETDPATSRTPSARTTLPSTFDPVTALVADEALSRLVEPDPSAEEWQGARLAEQRWLAETAVIAAERPGESRTLVVVPRRQADLVPAVAANAIADTGRLPWLCGVPLADAAAGAERCATLPDTQGPAPADGTAVLRSTVPDVRPLLPSYVRDIARVRAAADQLTEQVLVSESAKDTKARLLRARGRAASTAWRERPRTGRRLLDLLEADVEALRGQITLVGRPTTLTGRAGTIQLVVQNGLDQPVNVGVRLDPTSAVRLTSEDTAIQTVPPRSTQQVSVQVEARTSGRFTARAQLVDASGQAFGESVELDVRSTEYGRVALAVTGVAAAVLLVAAGARLTRRALRGPRAAPVEPREPVRRGSGV